jgi:hypothetical protein
MVILAMRLIYHGMKAYGGVELSIAPFLALVLDWESGRLHGFSHGESAAVTIE